MLSTTFWRARQSCIRFLVRFYTLCPITTLCLDRSSDDESRVLSTRLVNKTFDDFTFPLSNGLGIAFITFISDARRRRNLELHTLTI